MLVWSLQQIPAKANKLILSYLMLLLCWSKWDEVTKFVYCPLKSHETAWIASGICHMAVFLINMYQESCRTNFANNIYAWLSNNTLEMMCNWNTCQEYVCTWKCLCIGLIKMFFVLDLGIVNVDKESEGAQIRVKWCVMLKVLERLHAMYLQEEYHT